MIKIEPGTIIYKGYCDACDVYMAYGSQAYDILDMDGGALTDSVCSLTCASEMINRLYTEKGGKG